MSARYAAILCAASLTTMVGASSSTHTSTPDAALVVFLSGVAKQPKGPMRHMQAALSGLMQQAGYRIEWREGNGGAEVDRGDLIVLELRGVCDPTASLAARGVGGSQKWNSLGSSAVEGLRVLPFASVDCSALNRIVSPELVTDFAARREEMFGRAMARVAAHEFYHILQQTTRHTRHGIAKSSITAAELLSDDFGFETTAVSPDLPSSAPASR
jgi:hypothetical protein